jgi:hypothetical protein
VLPEVVCLTETNNVRRVNANLIYPDVVSLLVVLIDGGPKKVCGDLEPAGEEFPGPCDCLLLEVVAEGEVTQHLEEGAVTGGVTNALKVGGSDALLTSGYAVTGRLLFACEELLHRSHTRVYEKKGFVVMRNEGVGRETKVSLGFKEGEILFSQIVKGCPFHNFI